MSAPTFAPLRPTPKPQPADFQWACESCGRITGNGTGKSPALHYYCENVPDGPLYSGPFPRTQKAALWGHEWAAVARLAMVEADRDEFAARLREVGEDLMRNGRDLAEKWPDQALEGRARVMAGLSLCEVAHSWPQTKRHAELMGTLQGLAARVAALVAGQDTGDSGTPVSDDQ